MAFEKIIEEFIKPGIKAEIDRVINEEIKKAETHVRERIKEMLGYIAVHLAHQFNVTMGRNEIIITYREEDGKRKD